MFFDGITIGICACLALLAVISLLADTFSKKIPTCEDKIETGQGRPVSVIVISDNNARELQSGLQAFLSQDYPAGYEVIVVVDKDEDGTGDVLKAYGNVENLYTTFVPDSSRYMSRRKLAVTLGVKAAKHELVILTDATCRPLSSKWIGTMVSSCTNGVDMVLGYSNYEEGIEHSKMFFRFHREYALFREAVFGTAYGMAGNNLMFKKSMFMSGNGFQGNLKYLRGEYDFLVNKYASKGNVAVAVNADAYVVETVPSKKAWHDRNVFYVETRKHLRRSFRHRMNFCIDMFSLHACFLASLGSMLFAVVSSRWIVLVLSILALCVMFFSRIYHAKHAMRVFNVSVPLWKVVPFELGIVWHDLKYMIIHKFADKYEFISHKS